MKQIIETITQSSRPLIISSSEVKMILLKHFSNAFKNIVYKSFSDFKKDFFPEISYNDIFDYHLETKEDLEISKMKLQTSLLVEVPSENEKIEELYQINQRLQKKVINNNLNKYLNRDIFIINYYDNDNLMNLALKKLPCEVQKLFTTKKATKQEILEFETINHEVSFIVNKINKLLLDGVSPERIIINQVSDAYQAMFKEAFALHHIDYDLGTRYALIDYPYVKEFISKLKTDLQSDFETQFRIVFESALALDTEHLQVQLLKYVLDGGNILFQYHLKTEDALPLFEYYLSQTSVKLEKYQNLIRFENIFNNIYDEDSYLFLSNFHQDYVPSPVKDKGYLLDEDLKSLNLKTSTEINSYNKQQTIDTILNYPKLVISYALSGGSEILVKNALIAELKEYIEIEEVETEFNIEECLSRDAALISYRRAKDQYDKFNHISHDLLYGYNTFARYDNVRYNNNFKGIDSEVLDNYRKNNRLSYSTLDILFKCPFNFYLRKILKIQKDQETAKDNVSLLIGSLYHHLFENFLTGNNDIEQLINNYLSENKIEVTKKLKFYIEQLKVRFLEDYDIITEYMKNSDFKPTGIEEKVDVKLSNGMTFTGTIDKVLNYQNYYAVIDYKTRDVKKVDWHYLDYGLELQLPIYLYLLKKRYPNALFAGAYLQSILENNPFRYNSGHDYITQKRSSRRYQGYTNRGLDVIEAFDKVNDTPFRSLPVTALTSKNKLSENFLKRSFTDEQFELLVGFVQKKLDDAVKLIDQGDFKIAPFTIKGYCDSCSYCHNKEICYLKESQKEEKLTPDTFPFLIEGDERWL